MQAVTIDQHVPPLAEPARAGAPAPPPWAARSIVLVGLMGAGKSTVGRRLADALGLPFVDADHEIEAAAGRSVSEIFATLGEPAFRDGERRVIARLLDAERQVIATGGGAFVSAATRDLVRARAISVWLRAEIDELARRVSRRDTRPLLRGADPKAVLARLLAERAPYYETADITVDSGAGTHGATVAAVLAALAARGVPVPDRAFARTPPEEPDTP